MTEPNRVQLPQTGLRLPWPESASVSLRACEHREPVASDGGLVTFGSSPASAIPPLNYSERFPRRSRARNRCPPVLPTAIGATAEPRESRCGQRPFRCEKIGVLNYW